MKKYLINEVNLFSRMLHWSSGWVKAFISLVSAMFFINHFAYLSVGRFDYQYNMKANILTGKINQMNYMAIMTYLFIHLFHSCG